MVPRFTDATSWQQAELLMQPALLRVIDNIRKQLEDSTWQGSYEDIDTPIPGHQLCLQQGDRQFKVNLWDLCFQVCCRDYNLFDDPNAPQDVEIDTTLIDEEGEVDWQQLETKTQQVIEQIFVNLPTSESPNSGV